jgi:hypothetical protein
MKSVQANTNQTLFDIALRETGSIEGVFDLLEANSQLRLDLAVPTGTKVMLPGPGAYGKVIDYYSRNSIKPVSGLGEDVQLSDEDLTMIIQNLDYNLVNGDHEFDRVRLFNLRDRLTVQINYSGIGDGDPDQDPPRDWHEKVKIFIDQSLDGINFSHVPRSQIYLDPDVETHTYNIIGLLTNYVRACVQLVDPSVGIIHQIIWKVL